MGIKAERCQGKRLMFACRDRGVCTLGGGSTGQRKWRRQSLHLRTQGKQHAQFSPLVPHKDITLSTMQRSESSASEGSFWTTIELLADRGRRRRSAADADDIVPALNLPSRRTSAARCLF